MPTFTPMPIVPGAVSPRVELTPAEFDVPIFQLTPESILQMLQIRLGDLDEQIETTTSALQNNATTAQSLSRDIQLRREIVSAARAVTTETDGNLRWDDFNDDAGGGVAPREHLEGLFEQVGMQRGGRGVEPNMKIIEDQMQRLEDQLRTVNSGNEMLMVSLQSTMQQRTSAVQMATNMLKSIDESTDSIVGNLR